MTGWLILIGIAAVTLAAILLVARPGRGAIQVVAAGLALGCAGYAWQGHPGQAGKPTPPRASQPPGDTLFAQERTIWLERVGPEAQQLDAADAFIRNGDVAYAVGILRGAVARVPDSMSLWLGLANALVTYADGSVTPPARYAFQRAASLAPRHPAPGYFMALAYAQSGDFDTAERIWRAQLAAAPADAPWRLLVQQKLSVLERFRAAG